MDCPDLINVDINTWQDIPVLTDRTGTDKDVVDCLAVFGTGPGSTQRLTNVKLPARAILTDENGAQHEVIVIQAEYAFSLRTKLVGYIIPGETKGVATMDEVEFID